MVGAEVREEPDSKLLFTHEKGESLSTRLRFLRRAQTSGYRRFGWRLLISLVLLALIPPGVAYASTVVTYAQGIFGVGGVYHTTGFAARDFNRVYHANGYYWQVLYQHTDGSTSGYASGFTNPTIWPNPDGYAKAFCANGSDDSGVTWTCQTTTP
jgi:hypothetical protein